MYQEWFEKNEKIIEKSKDSIKTINREKLLDFINNKENIIGMSDTYPEGFIMKKHLLEFIKEVEE